ncbi:hypothetical protein QMK19_20400 [Streptomyces sp. H10-C2]|uniref:hypothetical protein n=1 Tax=unclassified Streptomyces TaxID=2593676 RepID=UPI0024B9F764|nr:MULTISPECIES: hypothetical protein [unclassified Streptomyces]MDJ0340753.1 hypothetical protein [Streptomyces sp. PH10-H1]MDJ0371975.1 hypothetical protein [Streptomyces sp. H10-C2]
MGNRQLGRHPRSRYTHLLSSERHSNYTQHRPATFAIPVERPVKGCQSTTLACETCRTSLTYTVFSIPATRARRWAWLLATLAGAASVLLSVLTIHHLGEQNRSDPGGGMTGLLALGSVGGFIVAATGLSFWWHEDGVRGPGRLTGIGGHSIKR